jgi:uncharacterized protein (TIGR00369 family)
MSPTGEAGDEEESTAGDGEDDTGTDERDGDIADAAEAAFEADLDEYPLFDFLGVEVESVEPGHVVLAVPFSENLINISGKYVHGGVTATVLDTASGMALRSTFDDPGAANLTTTDLNVRYVRPARDDLRVEAEVVRAGSTMGVTETEVTTVHGGEPSEARRAPSDEQGESEGGERKVVATGGTTYRLFRGEDA